MTGRNGARGITAHRFLDEKRFLGFVGERVPFNAMAEGAKIEDKALEVAGLKKWRWRNHVYSSVERYFIPESQTRNATVAPASRSRIRSIAA